MRKKRFLIFEGSVFGQITVGSLVYDVQNHELFLKTPQSYLQHGRLYECTCKCGNMVLYSENVLQTGQIKSCGCLRLRNREIAHLSREERERKKAHKKEIAHRIRMAQDRLKFLQTRPSHIRLSQENQLEQTALGAELRKLFAMKASANRKESPKETWKRKMEEW